MVPQGEKIGERAPIQIKVFGGWSVTLDEGGKPLQANENAILHALVMSNGTVARRVLEAVLPPSRRVDDGAAVRETLHKLRKRLDDATIEGRAEVTMPRQPEKFAVDLWEYLDLAAEGRHGEAHVLNPEGKSPSGPPGAARHSRRWASTSARLAEARRQVEEGLAAKTRLRESVSEAREELLQMPVAPGVGRQAAIEEVEEVIAQLPFRWRKSPPHGEVQEDPPSQYLTRLLAAQSGALRKVIVTGAAGMGKTLTAKLTFLRLAEPIVAGIAEPRPLLYLDATIESGQDDFASDAWLERRLQETGAEPDDRAVLILAHADSLFSDAGADLIEILGRRMFRNHDILIFCSEQLYARGLKHAEFETHVLRLEAWTDEMQGRFAEAMAGAEARDAFESWRDEDPETREKICATPLHLVHLLSFVEEGSEPLQRISTPWHIFDQVARLRLKRARFDEAEQMTRMRELAGLAHRFYVAGEHADRPIGFNGDELRAFLGEDGGDVEQRVAALLDRTLLSVPEPASDEIHFEEASWGWYFAARHLHQCLIERRPVETPLQAFAKFFSLEVMERVKEMLREALPRHRDQILSALRHALLEDPDEGLQPGPKSISREQIAYLLGILGDEPHHHELLALVDPESSAWDPDPLVRRGAVVGLANRGNREVADRYLERLRAEWVDPGPNVERDANIQFLLGFHRVRPFEGESLLYDIDPAPAVEDLVRGLEDDRHVGSWRVKLFTLVDLGRHPAISSEAYEKAISIDRERLRRILVERLRDDSTRDWPELGELREILGN